jgi:hypothetical protein
MLTDVTVTDVLKGRAVVFGKSSGVSIRQVKTGKQIFQLKNKLQQKTSSSQTSMKDFKLQEKYSAFLRDIQLFKTTFLMFIYFVGFFVPLDPDSDPQNNVV